MRCCLIELTLTGKNLVVLQGLDDLGDARVNAVFARLDDALWVEWGLIWRVDSGES